MIQFSVDTANLVNLVVSTAQQGAARAVNLMPRLLYCHIDFTVPSQIYNNNYSRCWEKPLKLGPKILKLSFVFHEVAVSISRWESRSGKFSVLTTFCTLQLPFLDNSALLDVGGVSCHSQGDRVQFFRLASPVRSGKCQFWVKICHGRVRNASNEFFTALQQFHRERRAARNGLELFTVPFSYQICVWGGPRAIWPWNQCGTSVYFALGAFMRRSTLQLLKLKFGWVEA